MPHHFESNIGPYYNQYTNGGAAFLKGEPRKAPFDDQKSPEAVAWFQGYDDAHIGGGEKRLKEIAKLEKWYNL